MSTTKFNMVLRVWEVLDSFDVAREAYECVLARPTKQEEVAKNVICLLIWLETIVGIEVLHKVPTMASDDGTMLSQLVAEADAVHRYVVIPGEDRLPEHVEGIPTIVALCSRGKLVDFRFFKFQRALVARGLDVIWTNLAPLLFDDHLQAMLRRYKGEAGTVANATPAPELMEPFVVQRRTPLEDCRTVFVSFPAFFPECRPPLSAHQIWDFFDGTEGLARCVESVGMELPRAGQTPKHGVVVFRSAELRDEVTCNETAIIFRVMKDRDMWVQHYRPLF